MHDIITKINTLETENIKLSSQISLLENRLSIVNMALINIVGRSLDGILIVNSSKMVMYANYSAIKLFDKNIADLLSEPLDLSFDLEQSIHNKNFEYIIEHTNGDYAVTEVSLVKTDWDNKPCFVIIFRDITERKNTVQHLEYKINHDHLTGLPNRAYFENRLIEDIELTKINNLYLAVLYLDVDNFKAINDAYGHASGDELLKLVANSLRNSIRSEDTVARLGGDEFAIIISKLKCSTDVESIARKIQSNVCNINKLMGNDVMVSISIGIALFPNSGSSPQKLLKNSDLAMYFVKRNGKNNYKIYE